MPLPNPSMSFSPFAILTAEEMNNIIENVEALQDWTAFDNDSFPTALIDDEAITHPKISTGADMNWQSWTPTFGALSGGTLNYAKYIQLGKTVHFKLKYTLAGAGVSGPITVTMPVTPNADYSDGGFTIVNASGLLRDASISGNRFQAAIVYSSGNEFSISCWRVNGSNVAREVTSSTIPFTWAAGDIIYVEGSYEAA